MGLSPCRQVASHRPIQARVVQTYAWVGTVAAVAAALGIGAVAAVWFKFCKKSSCCLAPAAPVPTPLPQKYVAATNQIRLGHPADATHGLPRLLGVCNDQTANYLQDPEEAIKRKFAVSGDGRDQENLARILAGTYLDSHRHTKTLDELLQHPYARMADLKRHHVLVLRLYTTESYPKFNNALRQEPPLRPHPFAATAFFMTEGIRLVQAVAAHMPDPNSEQIYYRGMKDLGITTEFRAEAALTLPSSPPLPMKL